MKEISSKTNIFNLINNNPDIKEIMAELGFVDILKPGMLNSAGRFMNLEKGAKLKAVDWEIIEKKFAEHGYKILRGEQR